MPILRRWSGAALAALTLDQVPAQVHASPDGLLDRGAGDFDTETLLAIVFRGAEVDRDELGAFSQHIDSGRPTMIAARREHSAAVLAAAFELARRAAHEPAPELIRGPADVASVAHRELGGLRRERVIAIVCDAANRPLRTVVVSDGAVDRSLLPVREILNAVLRWDGRAFAVAHNHPCGNVEPSDSDVAATHRIAEAARVVGLRFLGHVVVGDGQWAAVAT